MLKHFRILLASAVCVAIATLLPPPVSAAEESIVYFTSQISLTSAGTASVTETITYDFGSQESTGIVRSIPTQYRLNGDQVYDVNFDLYDVRRNGALESYTVNEDAHSVNVNVGRSGDYLSGIQTYEITYTLWPMILGLEGGDVFRFEVTGNDWTVPIAHAQAKVGPMGTVIGVNCYRGSIVNQDPSCTTARLEFGGVGFASQNLAPGEGMTLEITYPASRFSWLAEPYTAQPVSKVAVVAEKILSAVYIVLSYFIVVLFFMFQYSTIKHFLRRRRWQRSQLVAPQYKPPADLTPAEVGLLNDDRTSPRELTATLIDLADRGYLKITPLKQKLPRGKQNFQLELLKPHTDAHDFEQDLLKTLFRSKNQLRLNELIEQTMLSALANLHRSVRKRLIKAGYYTPRLSWGDLYRQRREGLAKRTVLSVFRPFSFLILPPFVVFDILNYMIFPRISDAGMEQWAYIQGFKKFLTNTQKERMAFHDTPGKQHEQFSQYLSYAVALGVDSAWTKQFLGASVANNPFRYFLSHGSLSGNLNHEIKASVSNFEKRLGKLTKQQSSSADSGQTPRPGLSAKLRAFIGGNKRL